MGNNKKIIVFDMDGVIINSLPVINMLGTRQHL